MERHWRETFLLYSRFEEHIHKRIEAERIIEQAFNECRKPYVAFSGGKDSLCVAHLVTRKYPDVVIVHWDYGRYYVPRELEQEILDIAKRLDFNLRVYTSPKYERLKRKAINVLGTDYIGKVTKELYAEGFDCVFLGLRQEESLKRKRRIKARRSLTQIKEYYPIATWTWLDVWAYIVSNDLPYLSFYDGRAKLVGWQRARFTTLFDSEFDKLGASNIDGVQYWWFKNQL